MLSRILHSGATWLLAVITAAGGVAAGCINSGAHCAVEVCCQGPGCNQAPPPAPGGTPPPIQGGAPQPGTPCHQPGAVIDGHTCRQNFTGWNWN